MQKNKMTKIEKQSEKRFELLIYTIIIWLFVVFSEYIPTPYGTVEESNAVFYVTLLFAIVYTFRLFYVDQKLRYDLGLISSEKELRTNVIFEITNNNPVAEYQYECEKYHHYYSLLEIKGSEIVVEFEVPSNIVYLLDALDFGQNKPLRSNQIIDYITEIS